jgi:hypothetical protein
MQISKPANLKRMISDKASQNNAIDERGEKPTKVSKKVKRCCFLLFLVICQAQSIQNHVTIKFWIKSYNYNDHPVYKVVKLQCKSECTQFAPHNSKYANILILYAKSKRVLCMIYLDC